MTRCLSPLGTGNDETGSDELGERGVGPIEHARRSRCPPLWKLFVVGLIPRFIAV